VGYCGLLRVDSVVFTYVAARICLHQVKRAILVPFPSVPKLLRVPGMEKPDRGVRKYQFQGPDKAVIYVVSQIL